MCGAISYVVDGNERHHRAGRRRRGRRYGVVVGESVVALGVVTERDGAEIMERGKREGLQVAALGIVSASWI